MRKVIIYRLVNGSTFYNILEIPERLSRWYSNVVSKNLHHFTDEKIISAYKHIFPLSEPAIINADEVEFVVIEDLNDEREDQQSEKGVTYR